MKRFIAPLALAFLLVAGDGHGEAGQEQSMFMRAKLVESQKILEALALEDYKTILNSANQLKLLSLDSNWQVLTTEDYVWYSKDFRRAADALAEGAAKKNLDAALLGYIRLTQSCVSCHKHVRSQQSP